MVCFLVCRRPWPPGGHVTIVRLDSLQLRNDVADVRSLVFQLHHLHERLEQQLLCFGRLGGFTAAKILGLLDPPLERAQAVVDTRQEASDAKLFISLAAEVVNLVIPCPGDTEA